MALLSCVIESAQGWPGGSFLQLPMPTHPTGLAFHWFISAAAPGTKNQSASLICLIFITGLLTAMYCCLKVQMNLVDFYYKLSDLQEEILLASYNSEVNRQCKRTAALYPGHLIAQSLLHITLQCFMYKRLDDFQCIQHSRLHSGHGRTHQQGSLGVDEHRHLVN